MKIASSGSKLTWRRSAPFAAATLAIGIIVVLAIHAAGTPIAFEAESGTLSTGATVASITGQSGTGAVKFTAAATPTPTSTPAAGACPAYPAFPDASCTGVQAGITLTPSGSITASTAGATIQNLDITGSINVTAANVTIKNCKVHSNGSVGPGIRITSGNAIIRNVEIYGFADEAIAFDNWAGYNLNIHGMLDDGVKLGSNVTLVDSYLHDFTTTAGAHADGGQMQSGETNILVSHNTIVPGPSGTNSALLLAPDLGPSSNGPVTLTNNLLGYGNYTLYILDGNNGQYHQKGYTVTGNHFQRNAQYGPVDVNEPAANFTAWSGNVYDDNGAVISGP